MKNLSPRNKDILNCNLPKMPANRLVHASSPYLLQHAHNPVDWFPWCDEAFEKAKLENKPVLLSIGYSACHWCHVMAHESFENHDIADVMNRYYVNIKVDREERPDLDQIYQSAVQLFIRRGGGWPLTMFLDANRIPFFGGTYFPPEDRYGISGFPKILEAVARAYNEDDIAKRTSDIVTALTAMSAVPAQKTVPTTLLRDAAEDLERIFDAQNGGFGTAPKFPSVPSLHLLLRRAHEVGETNRHHLQDRGASAGTTLTRVIYTLGKMAWGGIFDQIGGGFHRYSTDARWQVPHFEKMLYDNAQLATIYFHAYQATGYAFYCDIGEEILDYVTREMTSKDGGFYSTQDADSEGHEGRFFVWSPEEVEAVLGNATAGLFCAYYNITAGGNFEGKNIPHRTKPIDAFAASQGVSFQEMERCLADAKALLYKHRLGREKPFRDEKILTAWNGLMIQAFAEGYNVTRKRHYLDCAVRAAEFILTDLTGDKDGDMGTSKNLLRTYKDGRASLNAYLDDYAFFGNALVCLYEATGETRWLTHAERYLNTLEAHFLNTEGGFYFTSDDHEALIVRSRPYTDQSIPSGNAQAAYLALRLFAITADERYRVLGEKTLRAFTQTMEEQVFATGSLIAAADFLLRGPKEIVVVGAPEAVEPLLCNINKLYLPNKVVLLVDPQHRKDAVPLPARGKAMVNGQPTVYVCHRGACSPPLTDWEALREVLHPGIWTGR